MHVGEKSVGRTLEKAEQHSIKVARMLYTLADDESKALIDALGWREIP